MPPFEPEVIEDDEMAGIVEAVHDEEPPPPLLPDEELDEELLVDWPSLPIERSVDSRWLWAEERDTRVFPVF